MTATIDGVPANDYDAFAEAYAAETEANFVNGYDERPAMLDLAGSVTGRRVLDAGRPGRGHAVGGLPLFPVLRSRGGAYGGDVIDDRDRKHLRRCVELATQGLDAGDEPFGSVLVGADGTVLFEDRNRVSGGDETRHPEFEIARWSATNMTPADRAAATVYTSGEHCPMCAAAHAWVGLGRIVYASSTEQLTGWRAELGAGPSPVRALSITEIAPGVPVDGPDAELAAEVRELHRRHAGQ